MSSSLLASALSASIFLLLLESDFCFDFDSEALNNSELVPLANTVLCSDRELAQMNGLIEALACLAGLDTDLALSCLLVARLFCKLGASSVMAQALLLEELPLLLL